jgi:hypothetical protein
LFSGTSTVSAAVLNELAKFDLKDYLQDRLTEKYSFFRRVSIENIMKWQSKEITEPLTKLPRELQGVALQLFRSKNYAIIFYLYDV